jgi:multisubunit Na+/H+ antiporter MnhG subunit
MTTAPLSNIDLMTPPVVKTIQQRSLIIGLIFAVIAAVGAWLQPDQFYRAYLMAFMAWLGVTLGSMAILMLRHLTKGAWGMVIRRILGAAMRCVPLMAVLFIPLLFGIRRLYIWARPLQDIADKHLREHLEEITKTYLSVNGYVMRAVIYFAIWWGLSYFLTKWSAEQDHPPMRDNSSRFKALSGPGLILYGFTITFAVIDWVMSIDPSWISTIFGLSFLIGEVLSALAFAIVVERILFRYKPMSELLKPEQVHDHGKFMLAFIMVWAYFSFSQWLIIWAGNLPEEITWYMRRLNGGWGYVGLFLVLFHFAVPFVFLISRPFKRDITRLVWLAVWMLLMRYVDLFWIIEPNFSVTFHLTWLDIVVPIAMGGLWLAFFFRNLGSRPLVPAYDVFAVEVLEEAHE